MRNITTLNYPLSPRIAFGIADFPPWTFKFHLPTHYVTRSTNSWNHLIASASRRPSVPPPEKLTPHYQQQVKQSTSHFPALPSSVFIHGSKGPQGWERSFSSAVTTTWRRRSRGRCRVRHLTPRCSLWPIGCGSTPAALRPEYSRRNPSHNGTKGEREERERERRDTAGESSGAGGEGTRARSRNVALYAAFATPRGRDSSSLATDEGCCTKSLRQPRARAQNPYSPARSWHPRSVSHPSSLSPFTRKDGAPSSPSSSPSMTARYDSLSLAPSIVSPSRLTEFAVFLFLDTKGEGSFHPLFSAAVP